MDEAAKIKNTDIVNELKLPPVKIHCSVLAEDAIKAALGRLQGEVDGAGGRRGRARSRRRSEGGRRGMAVTLTEKATKQVKQLMESPEAARTVFLRMGVKGGGLLGDVATPSSSTPRCGQHDKKFEIDGVKVVVRHQELSLPERHDARLRDAGADGRLHLRQPQGEVELRLWHLVLGVGRARARRSADRERSAERAQGPFVFWRPRHESGMTTTISRCSGCRAGSRVDRAALAAALLRAVAAACTPTSTRRGRRTSRRAALEASALVNAPTGRCAIRSPRGVPDRARGGARTREGAAVKPKPPPDLLEEMFEIQESLEEARRRSAGRGDARAR